MTALTRRLVTTTTAVAMLATTAVSGAQADLGLPTDDTITPAAAPVDEPGDLAIAYPGTAPGAPAVTLTGDQVRLSNAVVSVDISLADNDVAIQEARDVVLGAAVDITTSTGPVLTVGSEELALSSGTRTAPQVVDVAADPDAARLAERHASKGVQAEWTLTPTTGAALKVTWLAYLREGSNYVSQTWTIAPADSAPGATANFSNAVLLDAQTSAAAYRGTDDGYPVTFGAEGRETAWVGVENPTVSTAVTDTSTTISIKRAKPVTTEAPISYTAAIGVAPEGQLRRSFTYYLERERIRARRNFLHYQSWYDLQPNPDGLNINPDKLTKAINIFGGEMTERDAKVDSYWVDDGWDYLRDPRVADESDLNVWDFDPTYYPEGFAPQLAAAESYGGSMSAWMSPFGGYGESPVRRGALNLSKPADEQFEMYSPSSFKLAGDKYYAHFRERMYDLIDNNGVQGFKLDGIGGGLYQTGPNETYRADYENLLKLSEEVHEHAPDTWINATVGTYGSPYWMWFVDSIYRDGNDARMTGQGTGQQQYVNYRDGQTYQNIVVEANLVPITTLMNHGFVFSNTTFGQVVDSNDLSDPDVRKKVADDLRNYYAMGFGLQEMYVKHSIVDPETLDAEDADWFWDTMADNAKWARANTALLTDAHWIGGDPAANQLYGTAAWSNLSGTDEAMVMVRNPSKYRVSIPLELGRDLELPEGAATKYRFTERDGQVDDFVAGAGTVQHVVLEPFQVLLFEGAPSTDPVTPSEPVTVDPSLLPLPSTCWAASADSEETESESSGAANAIDGDPGTKWHTGYSSGVDSYPHELTIDMGATNNVTKVGYLRRQDGGDNGNIKGYVLQVSTDGSTWLDAVAGDFPDNAEEQILEIPEELRDARFIRLKATSSQSGAAYAAVAELNVYGTAGDTGQLDRTDWKVTTDSEQTSGENGHASNAIDCKLSTYWHTQYDPSDDPMPHELVIDLGHPATINGFEWTGRQDLGTNGLIADHEILVSTDGQDWKGASEGTFEGRDKQTVEFDEVDARYVKLVATSAQNGGDYAGAAEVNVLGDYIRLVLPQELVVDDQPGTGSDSYTIPDTPHVQYLVNGNIKEPGTYVVPEGTTLVLVTASPLDGYLVDEGSPTEWRVTFSLESDPEPTVTATATATATSSPTATATATATTTSTATATSPGITTPPTTTVPTTSGPAKPVDVYITPGLHFVNGRHWSTTCEPYSQTVRCRTEIWSKQVEAKGGKFVTDTGWHFNNLTYLPSARSLWRGNPLGNTGKWSDDNGRAWMTECDTPRTGRNGCRTWIRSDVVQATAKPGGGYSYSLVSKFVFNNLVLFG